MHGACHICNAVVLRIICLSTCTHAHVTNTLPKSPNPTLLHSHTPTLPGARSDSHTATYRVTHIHKRTQPHTHIHTQHSNSVKNKSALLKGECRHFHWRYLDTAWSVGHYCANLQRPLRKPKNFDALKAQYLDIISLQG